MCARDAGEGRGAEVLRRLRMVDGRAKKGGGDGVEDGGIVV